MDTAENSTLYNEVFISYSRKNIAFAKRLVDGIYEQGYENVWIDWEDIEFAENWWSRIQEGIESAHNFVFLLTPDSAQSEVCYKEVDYAVQSGKRIIPIIHQDLTREDMQKIHPAISQHNWLPMRQTDDFQAGVSTLITTIKTDFEHVRAHTRLLTRAHEWNKDNRSQAAALSVGALRDARAWLLNADQNLMTPHPTRLHREYIQFSARVHRRRRILFVSVGAIVTALIVGLAAFAVQQSELNRILLNSDFSPGYGWREFESWSDEPLLGQAVQYLQDDNDDFLRLYREGVDNVIGYRTAEEFSGDINIETRFRLQQPKADHDFEIWLGFQDNQWTTIRFYDERGPDLFWYDSSGATGDFSEWYDARPGLEVGRWYEARIEVRGNVITAYLDGQQVLQGRVSNYRDGGVALITGGEAIVDFDYLNVYTAQ